MLVWLEDFLPPDLQGRSSQAPKLISTFKDSLISSAAVCVYVCMFRVGVCECVGVGLPTCESLTASAGVGVWLMIWCPPAANHISRSHLHRPGAHTHTHTRAHNRAGAGGDSKIRIADTASKGCTKVGRSSGRGVEEASDSLLHGFKTKSSSENLNSSSSTFHISVCEHEQKRKKQKTWREKDSPRRRRAAVLYISCCSFEVAPLHFPPSLQRLRLQPRFVNAPKPPTAPPTPHPTPTPHFTPTQDTHDTPQKGLGLGRAVISCLLGVSLRRRPALLHVWLTRGHMHGLWCVCPSGLVISCLIVCVETSVSSECKYARCLGGESQWWLHRSC